MADRPRVGVEHPRIRKPAYPALFPNRVNVWRHPLGWWNADRGDKTLETFPTHAEAIAYAQKIAREA